MEHTEAKKEEHVEALKEVRPYALVMYISGAPKIESSRAVDITPRLDPDSPLEHPVLVALRASGVTPSDVRSRVLVKFPQEIDAPSMLSIYAALCGFANRRLDVTFGDGDVIDTNTLDATSRSLEDRGRPGQVSEIVQCGAPSDSLAFVVGPIGVAEAEVLRYAKRVRMVPLPDPAAALAQFIAISAVRSRGDQDRLPLLNTEAHLGVEDDSDIDLDDLRKKAIEIRRLYRTDDRSALAPRSTLAAYQKDLLTAASLQVEAVMVALGSTTPGGGVWHCPRPHRHTHGDAIPSMRVESSRARCFRCDAEWVDPVRLTADVKGCTFDEAADWLQKVVEPQVAALIATVADRLPVIEA